MIVYKHDNVTFYTQSVSPIIVPTGSGLIFLSSSNIPYFKDQFGVEHNLIASGSAATVNSASISGSVAAGQLAFGLGNNTVTSSANLLYSDSTRQLKLTSMNGAGFVIQGPEPTTTSSLLTLDMTRPPSSTWQQSVFSINTYGEFTGGFTKFVLNAMGQGYNTDAGYFTVDVSLATFCVGKRLNVSSYNVLHGFSDYGFTLGGNYNVGMIFHLVNPATSANGSRLIMFGYEPLIKSVGSDNIGIGYRAGFETVSGSSNIYIGYQAGQNNVSGSKNVCIGYQAGLNETLSNKLHIGYSANQSLIEGHFSSASLNLNATVYVSRSLVVTGSMTVNNIPVGYNKLLVNDYTPQWTGSAYPAEVWPTYNIPAGIVSDNSLIKITTHFFTFNGGNAQILHNLTSGSNFYNLDLYGYGDVTTEYRAGKLVTFLNYSNPSSSLIVQSTDDYVPNALNENVTGYGLNTSSLDPSNLRSHPFSIGFTISGSVASGTIKRFRTTIEVLPIIL